jgi:hypothetical protein
VSTDGERTTRCLEVDRERHFLLLPGCEAGGVGREEL